MSFKKLPKTFRKNGFDYEIIRRTPEYALLRQFNFGVTYGHEVHKVRNLEEHTRKYHNPDGSLNIIHFEAKEILAGNEEFGTWAWSTESLEYAEKIYDVLLKGGDIDEIRRIH